MFPEILLILVGLIVIAGVVLFLLARFKPQALMPLVELLRRNEKIRDYTNEQAIKQAAANPELIGEMAGEMVSQRQADQLQGMLEGKSEEERLALLKAAESGNVAEAQKLLMEKPKTADQKRAQAQKRSKARAKNKKARQQRKRSRR